MFPNLGSLLGAVDANKTPWLIWMGLGGSLYAFYWTFREPTRAQISAISHIPTPARVMYPPSRRKLAVTHSKAPIPIPENRGLTMCYC